LDGKEGNLEVLGAREAAETVEKPAESRAFLMGMRRLGGTEAL